MKTEGNNDSKNDDNILVRLPKIPIDKRCCVITQTKSFAVLTCTRIETRTETRAGMKLKPNNSQITPHCCNNPKRENTGICLGFFIARDNELF